MKNLEFGRRFANEALEVRKDNVGALELVAATPDAMVNSSLRSLKAHHNTKATNS